MPKDNYYDLIKKNIYKKFDNLFIFNIYKKIIKMIFLLYFRNNF